MKHIQKIGENWKIDDFIKKVNEMIDLLNSQVTEEKDWTEDDMYFYIDTNGKVEKTYWDEDYGLEDRDTFMGVYGTREEAEARLEEIKNLIK